MEKQPSPYRGLFPPLFISIISIAGIGLIVWIVTLDGSKASAPQAPTGTPFKFIFLATETDVATQKAKKIPATSFLTPTNSEKEMDANTQIAASTSPTPIIGNPTGTQTTPQATRTPSTVLNEKNALPAGKYDDADERILYVGDWSSEDLIPDAFEETISYSTTIGSTASFSFKGQQLQIGYLGESDLGVLIISINENEFTLDQSNGAEWSSPILPYAVYGVVLTHQDGDQVFFDYITILGSP